MVGCSNDKKNSLELSFCRIPKIITNQGSEMEELSSERRRLWLVAISRDDLTEQKLINDCAVTCNGILQYQARSVPSYAYGYIAQHACKRLCQLAVILKIWKCFFGCAIKEIEFGDFRHFSNVIINTTDLRFHL